MIKIRLFALWLSVFIFALFCFSSPVMAVVKTSGDLEVTLDEPLFPSSLVWYPGLSVTKSFTVKNLGSATHTLALRADNTYQENDIADMFLWQVTNAGYLEYGGGNTTMRNFWDAGQVDITDIPAGNMANIDLTATLLPSVGNQFQGKKAAFDIVIGFVGGTSVTVSAAGNTVTNTNTATPTGGFAAGPAAGFVPGVLGATTIATATPSAQILGTQASVSPTPTAPGQKSWFSDFKNFLFGIFIFLARLGEIILMLMIRLRHLGGVIAITPRDFPQL